MHYIENNLPLRFLMLNILSENFKEDSEADWGIFKINYSSSQSSENTYFNQTKNCKKEKKDSGTDIVSLKNLNIYEKRKKVFISNISPSVIIYI